MGSLLEDILFVETRNNEIFFSFCFGDGANVNGDCERRFRGGCLNLFGLT